MGESIGLIIFTLTALRAASIGSLHMRRSFCVGIEDATFCVFMILRYSLDMCAADQVFG